MPLHLVPRSLLYIESVAEHKSIQAASRHLGVAASAIYRQINVMEDAAGVPIFERSSSGMKLTLAGVRFIRLSQRWRNDSARLWSDIQELQNLDYGELRLGAMDSMANGFIPQFLTLLTANFPYVQTEVDILSPDQAVEAILMDRCDIALAFNVRPSRELTILWTADLPLGCVASPQHNISKQENISLKDCSQYPIIFQDRSLAVRRYLEKHHNWLFQEEPQTIITNSLQLLKKMVVAGQHIALTSEFDAAPEILSGDLIFTPINDQEASPQTVSVICRSRGPLATIIEKITKLLCLEVESYLNKVRNESSA